MEIDESKKESNVICSNENKDNDNVKNSANEDNESTNINIATENSDVESRRSSVSLDDEEEGKRVKRRKDKEDHCNRNKEEHGRSKEEHNHKKDDSQFKKDDHNHKKEEHSVARNKNNSGNNASPKSQTSNEVQDTEDGVKSMDSPGPKVPPLKIVIPSAETEQGSSRNSKCNTRHHVGLPYVVVSNDDTTTAPSTVTTSPSSPNVQTTTIKEDVHSPISSSNLLNEDQKVQQRVLRSTHSRGVANISNNGCSSGNNSSATSGNSSPVAPDLSPQQDVTVSKDENNSKNKIDLNLKGKSDIIGKKVDSNIKIKTEVEDEKSNIIETRNISEYHNKEQTNTVELHPRKRKLKSKQELSHSENDHLSNFGVMPHPHEVPVTNCYQMFMDIRRQIDVKRKGLFPIQPKPPQGFKDYLMNRCTYTLAGNSVPRLKRRNAEPPEGIPEGMKELYQEQEAERYSLRMQHVIEKEKLVLSVEQEILRVHGRAARALANQALPFSACTILKDEEVYNVITPEQEEKDRNARSRYNGRLFISWLQDVDDKWEKIKEEMLDRHHKEAESLNAIQKFNWDLKMRQLGLWKSKKFISVEDSLVPMISVSDDFDLLPE